MEKSYESIYHALEEVHWWFKGRCDIIIKLIEDFKRNSKILEIGCSGGPLLKLLNKKGFTNVYGIDLSKKAIKFCKKREIKNVFIMDGTKTKFKKISFDLIISSDSLEHMKEDNKALNEWRRILKNNGKLIIFVPAFNLLWSEHDELNYHYRRYSRKQLIKVVKKAKFKIIRASYWNFILFFPISLRKLLQRFFLKNKSQLYKVPRLLNLLLTYALKLENIFVERFNLPIGVSVFVIAQKF